MNIGGTYQRITWNLVLLWSGNRFIIHEIMITDLVMSWIMGRMKFVKKCADYRVSTARDDELNLYCCFCNPWYTTAEWKTLRGLQSRDLWNWTGDNSELQGNL